MDSSLLLIMLSCFTCCMFFHVAGRVHDVGDKSHPCLDEERSALLEFIQGLTVERLSDAVYHKTDSWRDGVDCCASWDGVECDRVTGHVIGLDLNGDYMIVNGSTRFISGSISGNNSLFQLFHLQRLNLSYNHIEGQIPSSIFHLSNLTSLDLSSYSFDLRLHKPNLRDLVHNLTKLEHLHLNYVDLAGSRLSDSLSNYSCLKSLRLSSCGLGGEFPSSSGIFHLSKLRILDLSYNSHLNGPLPEFDGNNSLEELRIRSTNISGELPSSFGELSFLKVLDIHRCSFSGRLTPFSRLVSLTHLDISFNDFNGQMVVACHSQLVTIDLSNNQLTGQIPSCLSSLAKLETLWLFSNHFTGFIPRSLTKLTSLRNIDLSSNQFEGAIPNSFSNFSKLQSLDLHSNKLNGTVELDMFHKLRDLSKLRLSQNNLSLLVSEGTHSVTPDKYKVLDLGSCNLNKFPTFLLNQSRLEFLDFSQNNMHRTVPTWIWNHSLALSYLNISHNFLTTIEGHPIMLPGSSLNTLDISFNILEGSLPVPPLSTRIYVASSNSLSGYLSPLFCNLSDISVLDVSNNAINGTIPHCPNTFAEYLSILNLQKNKLHGTIPQSWMHGAILEMIALSQNQLQGNIPRSLARCTMLEFIDFGNNLIVDTFPSWLGDLPDLKVLMLQSNNFHGEIQKLEGDAQFEKLRVIDLSSNGFSGKLPSMFFQSWEFMKSLDTDTFGYMEYFLPYDGGFKVYDYTMEITNKGMERKYPKIPTVFRAIDFSHNQFEGKIPTSIAKLEGLYLLNLGHNNLSGTIPSWLGSLHQLESLDLSHNKLSGKIPRELSQLSFLGFFSVSYNNLSGIIPRGGHLDTFGNNSYEGNPGLLAYPQSEPPTSKTRKEEAEEEMEDEEVFDVIEWMVILIGCASGLVVGAVLGNEFAVRKPKWFVKLLGRWL